MKKRETKKRKKKKEEGEEEGKKKEKWEEQHAVDTWRVHGWILPIDLTWASEVALKAVAKHPSVVWLCFHDPEHGRTYCLAHIIVNTNYTKSISNLIFCFQSNSVSLFLNWRVILAGRYHISVVCWDPELPQERRWQWTAVEPRERGVRKDWVSENLLCEWTGLCGSHKCPHCHFAHK